MTFVIDSSALLAALLGEKGSEVVEPLLDQALISTVNIAEVAAALVRGGNPVEDVRRILAGLGLAAIAPDEAMAIDAGLLRAVTDEAGLSLGDRFCLALARRVRAPAVTADRAWRKVAAAAGVEVRSIR